MVPQTFYNYISFQVLKDRKGVQELWILTSRFQKIATGTLTSSEVNFRVLAGKVSDLVFGTRCARNPSETAIKFT